jgi:hypothetical protein
LLAAAEGSTISLLAAAVPTWSLVLIENLNVIP